MLRYWRVGATAGCVFGLLAASCSAGEADSFRPLLNGKDLAGWVIEHGPAQAWSVQEGSLQSNAPPKCYLRTQDEYMNYVLRLQWRLLSDGSNSGVFLCGRDIGEEFPQCLEVQIYHKNPGAMFPIRKAVGGPTALPWEEHARPIGEWNQFELAVYNGCVFLSLNGHLVNQANIVDPQIGHIGLQCETGQVQFRNIEIKEIVDPLPDVRWGAGRRSGAKAPGRH